MNKSLLLFLLLSSFGIFQPLMAGSNEGNPPSITDLYDLYNNGSQSEAINQLKLHQDSLYKAADATKNSTAFYKLGYLYFYAQMDPQALLFLNKAIEYNPKFSQAYYHIGLIHMYAQKYDMAEKALLRAIELDQNDDRYHEFMGIVLEKKGKPNAALQAYKQALKINQNNFNANNNLASIYLSKRDHQNAEIFLLKAYQIQPKNIQINYNLGLMYKQTQQTDLALKYFSNVVQLNPKDGAAIVQTIQAHQLLGNLIDRDKSVNNLYQLWHDGDAGKTILELGVFVREQSTIDREELIALEYFKPEKPQLKKVVFKLFEAGSKRVKLKVILHKSAKNMQQKNYYLDGYPISGEHYRYAYFDSEPDYDTLRELVENIATGEQHAIEIIEKSYYSGGDGSSIEQAVTFPNAKTSGEGISLENRWLQTYYSGYKKIGQGVRPTPEGKLYDVITIKDSDGIEKKIYFEMTDWFGFGSEK